MEPPCLLPCSGSLPTSPPYFCSCRGWAKRCLSLRLDMSLTEKSFLELLCLTDALFPTPQVLPRAECPSSCLGFPPPACPRPPYIWISPDVPSVSVWKFYPSGFEPRTCSVSGSQGCSHQEGRLWHPTPRWGERLARSSWEGISSPVFIPAPKACLALS